MLFSFPVHYILHLVKFADNHGAKESVTLHSFFSFSLLILAIESSNHMIMCDEIAGISLPLPQVYLFVHISKDLPGIGRVCINDR